MGCRRYVVIAVIFDIDAEVKQAVKWEPRIEEE
jgi:hypothetical protein